MAYLPKIACIPFSHFATNTICMLRTDHTNSTVQTATITADHLALSNDRGLAKTNKERLYNIEREGPVYNVVFRKIILYGKRTTILIILWCRMTTAVL